MTSPAIGSLHNNSGVAPSSCATSLLFQCVARVFVIGWGKAVANSAHVATASAGVRHNRWRGTKYYRFNGQTVAMRKNGVLSYLHGDHLGSTFATTNGSGASSGQQWYHAAQG
ncbi:MAG: hypothetical protein DYG89_02155 [Caldilinea sp. CFX5]|nr:hypothetical protein [Caldilinea sp. CFX5]